MAASITQIPNQTIMISILFGFLIAWMVTFAVLAFRSEAHQSVLLDDLPTPADSFPAIHAAMPLHAVAPSPLPASLELVSQDADEISKIPIA